MSSSKQHVRSLHIRDRQNGQLQNNSIRIMFNGSPMLWQSTSRTRALHASDLAASSVDKFFLSPSDNLFDWRLSRTRSQGSHWFGRREIGTIGGTKPVRVSISKSCATMRDGFCKRIMIVSDGLPGPRFHVNKTFKYNGTSHRASPGKIRCRT